MYPFIQIGSYKIASFFIVISLSLTLLMFYLSIRVDQFNKNRKIAYDLVVVLMLAGFIGGRAMHVFFEEWGFYKDNLEQILYFWQGGFVFFGGLIACCLAGALYSYIKKIDFPEWSDFLTPLFSLAHAFGRLGCLLSGCCFGKYCPLPWAINQRHPTALYLLLAELIIFVVLITIEKKQLLKKTGQLFFLWLLLHSLVRFCIEYIRDDFRGIFFNLPIFGSVSISQFLCLVIIAISLVYFASQNETSSKP